MFTPGWSEMLIIGFIALLLFGKRLPEVARSLGQGLVEFKKGMKTMETDLSSTVYNEPAPRSSSQRNTRIEEDLRPTTEKFSAPDEAETEAVVAEEEQK